MSEIGKYAYEDVRFALRDVLLSTGEFTKEAYINLGDVELCESAPEGLTISEKEASVLTKEILCNYSLLSGGELLHHEQRVFDDLISGQFNSQITTALSLVRLRFAAHQQKFHQQDLHTYITREYAQNQGVPKPILNVLNGGKHANNGLAFCEFMIVPQGVNFLDNITIASQVYLDLKDVIQTELGPGHAHVGREGGFAPSISKTRTALTLIRNAINKRHAGECAIAIDIAANNFAKTHISHNRKQEYRYHVDGDKYSAQELLEYYTSLIADFPEVMYLEDPFHERDVASWVALKQRHGNKILIVGDDLTVTNARVLEETQGCINAAILKVNQVGTFSGLLDAFEFCTSHDIIPIISQRSGETDSNIISHISVGLGAPYIKAGAPARERVIKYNQLLRISERLE